MTPKQTFDQQRTAKDPEAYVAKLRRSYPDRTFDIISTGDLTPSGQRRYTLRVGRPTPTQEG